MVAWAHAAQVARTDLRALHVVCPSVVYTTDGMGRKVRQTEEVLKQEGETERDRATATAATWGVAARHR